MGSSISTMDALKPFVPQQPGFLPWYLLIFSIVAMGNAVQAYMTTYYSKRIYCGPKAPANAPPLKPSQLTRGFDLTRSEATELSARTFGTWTFLSSIVRLYAAYNIDNPAIYQLATWTYGVAFIHFMLEWFYYKTTRWGAPLVGPVVVSIMGLIWMLTQRGFYVK